MWNVYVAASLISEPAKIWVALLEEWQNIPQRPFKVSAINAVTLDMYRMCCEHICSDVSVVIFHFGKFLTHALIDTMPSKLEILCHDDSHQVKVLVHLFHDPGKAEG
jgi:hypothetical protein